MLQLYFMHLDYINLVEFLFQIILVYNILQLNKQTNFYFLLSYFILNLIYLGLYLIIYDLDLNSVILWIIYGGLCIIFFIYSLMWFEVFKNFYKIINIKKNGYLYIFFFSFIFFLLLNLKFLNLKLPFENDLYYNFYNINLKNNIQELEILGWGIVYYLVIVLILFSYFLLLNCLIIFIIINNTKKLKNNLLNYYYVYLLKNKNLYYFSIIKNQYFFIQDYENLYQKNTLNKVFKINNFFHQIKNIKRRV